MTELRRNHPPPASSSHWREGGVAVVKGDWKDHITDDLRQGGSNTHTSNQSIISVYLCMYCCIVCCRSDSDFRSYQSSSVRDLLRAMRNKVSGWVALNKGLTFINSLLRVNNGNFINLPCVCVEAPLQGVV